MRNPASIDLDPGLTNVVAILRDATINKIWNNSIQTWESTNPTAVHLIPTAEVLTYGDKGFYEVSKTICDAAINHPDSQADSLQVRFWDDTPVMLGFASYGAPYEPTVDLFTSFRFLQYVNRSENPVPGKTEMIDGRYLIPKGVTLTNNSSDPSHVVAFLPDATEIAVTLDASRQRFEIQPDHTHTYVDIRLQVTYEGTVYACNHRVNQLLALELGALQETQNDLESSINGSTSTITGIGGAGPWTTGSGSGGDCVTLEELQTELDSRDMVQMKPPCSC